MSDSDASSVTSGASGAPSETQSMRDNEGPGGSADHQDGLENSHDVQAAVFGVVYTLSKEKHGQTYKFATAMLVLDFLQLFILIFDPSFGWHINESLWLWKYLSYLEFSTPLVAKGYHFMIIVMYIIIAVLGIGFALCIWVGWCFKNDRFPLLWPIKMLRFVLHVFFSVFYVATLSIFLMPLQCNYLDNDPKIRLHLDHFHNACFAMPHLAHAGAAALATVTFVFISVVMTMADFDPNPTSKAILAAASPTVALKAIALKTVMAIASVLDGRLKIQALVTTGAAWLLFWSYIRYQPHYNRWVNHIRSALYGALSWAGLLLLCLAFSKQQADPKFQKGITTALLAGLAPAFLVVFGASYLHFEYFYRSGIRAFRAYDATDTKAKLKDIYKFTLEHQVEMLARCCRQWIDEDTLDEDAVRLAELVIKVGMIRLSNSAGVTIFYSSFLIEVQESYQSALSQLQLARKMNPSICQKFIIFVREQQHRQRAQTNRGGESAVDLVSYVEFTRNYRSIVRSHKAALYATRYFWKQLLNHNISFSALTRAFANIERNQKSAEKAYRLILERYPTSPKLLRTYGRFLEDCKNDPWGAARFYSEAENIEEEAETAQNQASFGDEGEEGGDGNLMSNVDENTRAIVLINATGVIQMANKLALKVFGYKKGELEGKNVSILMPNPFSQRHNSYLRNYVTTGKPKILDTVREVVGINKERYVFPLRLNVTKASGSGSDAMFMGVLLAVEEPKDVVRCWLTPTGIVLCVNENFTDWFAMAHGDIVGKQFACLAVEQDRIAELLDLANSSSEEELKQGKVAIQGVQLLHKYLSPIPCNINCSLGGTDSQRLLLMQISRTPGSTEEAHNFMVTDYRGQISFATSGIAKMLGYTPRDMLRLNISSLMEAPFSYLHTKWLAELPPNPPSTSCRSGAVLAVVASNGNNIPIKTSIMSREVDDTTTYVVGMVKSSWEEGQDLHRLAASVGPDGIITEASNTPSSVFGFPASQIIGVGLDSFVETVHDIVMQEGMSMEGLQNGLMVKATDSPGISWRVGVHLSGEAASKWGLSSVRALVKPAVMLLEMSEADDCVRLFLHQAESLTGVIEVDREGRICKTGCCAFHQPGLIFGCASSAMMGQPLSKYVDLGGLSVADALLQAAEGQGKKALKTGSTAAPIKLGPVKKFHGHHADGEPLKLALQAVPKDASQRRIVVKISVVHPSKGSAAALKHSIVGAEATAVDQDLDLVKRTSSDGGLPTQGLHRVATGVPNRQGNRKVTDDVAGHGAAAAIRFHGQTDSQELAFLDQDAALAASQKVLGSWPEWDDQNAGPPPEDGNQSEMSGSETHVSDSASQAADGQGQGTDYRKGKRFKKLTRVLAGKRTQSAVSTFRQSTYAVLAGVLLTHLVCFVIFTKFIDSLQQYVYEVDAAGRASDMIHRIAMNTIILRELHEGRSAPGIYNVSDIPHYSNLMKSRVDEFELNHRGIYLGFKQLRHLKNTPGSPMKDIWELPNHVAEALMDIKAPLLVNETMTLWELGNAYIMSAREVMANNNRMANSSVPTTNVTTDMQLNRHWHFVAVNGPGSLFDAYKGMMDALVTRAMGQVKQVNLINVALLAVEGFAVCTVAIVVMWFLVRRVINMRYRLFSTFLIVPAGFLRVLASKQVHVDEDDVNDSDSDAEADVPAGNLQELGAPPKKGGALNAAGGNNSQPSFLQLDRKVPLLVEAQENRSPLQLVKKMSAAFMAFLRGQDTTLGGKRKLKRDAGDATRVLAPFVVWMALVLTVYAVSYTTLGRSSEGLIDNSIANSVLFRTVRVLFFAIKFCSRETEIDKEAVRPWVTLTATRLNKAYNTLMYGSVKGDYSDTKYDTPGTTFNKGAPVKFFFNSPGRCWRDDQSTCFGPDSEYYEISHNGLNPMLIRLVDDALLLARDDAGDVNMTNSRMAYIWKVANFDLHPGMQVAARQYTDGVLASFKSALNMHVGLFVMSWVLALLFVVLIMKPFLRRVDAESRRMAELLSQLPADMDVEALVAQALGTGGDEGDKRNDPTTTAKQAPAAAPKGSLDLGRSAKLAAADDTSGWAKARRASFSIPNEADA